MVQVSGFLENSYATEVSPIDLLLNLETSPSVHGFATIWSSLPTKSNMLAAPPPEVRIKLHCNSAGEARRSSLPSQQPLREERSAGHPCNTAGPSQLGKEGSSPLLTGIWRTKIDHCHCCQLGPYLGTRVTIGQFGTNIIFFWTNAYPNIFVTTDIGRMNILIYSAW